MAYTAPYIDETGLNFSSYADMRDHLINQVKSIYGQDIYLENDSADYQFISTFASMAYDVLLSAQLSYNSRNPATATGAALDGVVKLNGLSRDAAQYSICNVTITGTYGTVINNGVIQDVSGYKWNLPAQVTIPVGGSITISATCQTAGSITAQAGDINKIVTPTFGWVSVTNSAAASPGQPIEIDSQLKARQSISTGLSSQTQVESTRAAVEAVSGVTRCKVYENETNATDANGLVAHSIAVVVEGGTDDDVATAIKIQKNPGCGMNGTTTVNKTDSYGNVIPIKFYRPTQDLINVTVNIIGLTGYNSSYATAIQSAIQTYINSLGIGNTLYISALWGVALSVMPSSSQPVFSISSITAGIDGQAQGTTNISVAFNHVASPNTITVSAS